MIRVLTISDVVEPALYPVMDIGRFHDISMILSCGDLPPEYLISLVNATGAPLFYVRGNHDLRYQARQPQGCLDLHGHLVAFRGLKLLGLEGSMWYNGGPFQYKEQEMRRIIRGLRPRIWWRGGLDLVIAHAPPRGVHDEEDPCHQGFESFRWLIRKYHPRYFIHGHIHRTFHDPAERMTMVGSTQVINTYGFHLLEIDTQEDPSEAEKFPQA